MTITPVNDAPTIAAIDDVTTAQDTATSVSIAIDDVDDPIAALVVTATAEPHGCGHGLGERRWFRSRHHAGPRTSGVTTVEVVVSDGAATASTTFELTVVAANGEPSGVDDAYAIDEDADLEVADPAAGLLANDTDPDGDALTAGT